VTHLEHHRHLRTSRDPEEFTAISDRRWVHVLLFWIWGAIGGATYLVFVPVNGLVLGRRRDRFDIALEYALMGAFYATLLSLARRLGFGADLLHGLVLPWGVAVLFTNVRGWAEHAMTTGGGPLLRSRVVTSNGLVGLLMLGSNYHLVHHLYPAVPWYNLSRLYILLGADLRAAGASIYDSYLRFLVDAVRVGVHGVAAGASRRR
jgi:fatty acid desaturase